MKKINIILVIFAFGISAVKAQPTIQWEQSFGGLQTDVASVVRSTSDGGYITIGNTTSSDGDVTSMHGTNDYWVTKHNNVGDLMWQKALGGSALDIGTNIQETTDGGYIVIGYSESTEGDITGNHGGADVWVVKLTSTGVISWQKSFGGTGTDIGSQILETADGGYIVAARSSSADGDLTDNYGDYDAWLIKLTAAGDITWQKNYGGSNIDGITCVGITSDGGYLFGGYTSSNDGDVTGNHGDFDYWVIKTNATGDLLWQQTYGGPGEDICYAMDITSGGGAIFNGSSKSNGDDVIGNHGGYDYWVVKISDDGALTWATSIGGTADDDGRAVQQTNDGGYILAGRTRSYDGDASHLYGSQDYWVVKLRASGLIEWELNLGGTQADYANSIEQTADDGFIVAGCAYSFDENVSEGIGEGDFWLVKLSAFVGIEENEVVNTLSIYPNPAEDQFSIQVDDLDNQTTYQLIDITGKTVQAGTLTSAITTLDINELSAGIYHILVSSQAGMSTSKLIKK